MPGNSIKLGFSTPDFWKARREARICFIWRHGYRQNKLSNGSYDVLSNQLDPNVLSLRMADFDKYDYILERENYAPNYAIN